MPQFHRTGQHEFYAFFICRKLRTHSGGKFTEIYMARPTKIYSKSELTEKNLTKESELVKVDIVATYILDSLKKHECNDTASSDEIWNEYESLHKTSKGIVRLQKNTFVNYLCRLANDQQSLIECPGKKQGYWLDYSRYQVMMGNVKPKPQKTKEEVLYPVVGTWLELNGYRYVGNISKRKRSGRWRNPDLLGINLDMALGVSEIDIATVEVKADIDNWRHDIFEAVAHLMMANKSYFAFLCTTDEFEAEEMAMREYAQQYGVGLLAIYEDDKKECSYIVKLVQLAPPHKVPIDEQNDFLSSNNINNPNDLLNLKY